MSMPNCQQVVRELWALSAWDDAALAHLRLTGHEPVLPSSFAVSTAAQASLAVAALAAAEVRHARGQGRQTVSVDMRHASVECLSWFKLNGVVPDAWDKLSGLYRCGPGSPARWVRVHANFAHHRDGVLQMLGLPTGPDTERAAVQAALQSVDPWSFEDEAAQRGLVVATVRSVDEWLAHPQAQALAAEPLMTWQRIGDAPPRSWTSLSPTAPALSGLRVLELTRILAGPVAGRALAAHGADVLLVNSPHLPNISAIAETSRGKRSTHIDLRNPAGQAALKRLATGADVFLQAYRPGGLASLGFSAESLAQMSPGIVCVSLSAYGSVGPWATRRGFDSLVQSAMGFNLEEAEAAGEAQPKALPVQILDHATGLLMAYAAQAALARQRREGGSWHVQLSLAQTAQWLRSLGRQAEGLRAPKPSFEDRLETTASGFGELVAVRHAAQMSQTPVGWERPAMPPGSHPPEWAA